jgi:M6 family metalloprotease-like protein
VVVVCQYLNSPAPKITADHWAKVLDTEIRDYYLAATGGQTSFKFVPISGTCQLRDQYQDTTPADTTKYSVTNDPQTVTRDAGQAVLYADKQIPGIWNDQDTGRLLVVVNQPKRGRELTSWYSTGLLGFRQLSVAVVSEQASGRISTSDVSVIAHELGHELGLPDLYLEGTGNEFVDHWDPMAFDHLQNFSGYSRYAMGWVANDHVEPIFGPTPVGGARVILSPPNVGGATELVLLPVGHAPLHNFEGYMLEARAHTGRDNPEVQRGEDRGIPYEIRFDSWTGVPYGYQDGLLISQVRNLGPNPVTIQQQEPRDTDNRCPSRGPIDCDSRGPIVYEQVIGNQTDIFQDPLGAGPVTNVTDSVANDTDPAVNERSRQIAWQRELGGRSDIWLSNGNNTPVKLTDDAPFDGDPAWSPLNNDILFESDRDGNLEIYMFDSATTILRRLTNEPLADGAPSFSPDAKDIVFQSGRDRDVEVYRMARNGSNPQRLTDSKGFDGNPSWSPDGKLIAFESDRAGNGNRDIYVMPAAGGEPTRITSDPGFDGNPAWSSDGAWLLFESNRSGNGEIWAAPADDLLSPVNFTKSTEEQANPNWGSPSYPGRTGQLGKAPFGEGETWLSPDGSIKVTVLDAGPPGQPPGSLEVRIDRDNSAGSPDVSASDAWLDSPANGFGAYWMQDNDNDQAPDGFGDPVYTPTVVDLGPPPSVRQTTAVHHLWFRVRNEFAGEGTAGAHVTGTVFILGPEVPVGLDLSNPDTLRQISIARPVDVDFGVVPQEDFADASVEVEPPGPFVAVLHLNPVQSDDNPFDDTYIEPFLVPQFSTGSPYAPVDMRFEATNIDQRTRYVVVQPSTVPAGWDMNLALTDDPKRSFTFLREMHGAGFTLHLRPPDPSVAKPGQIVPVDLAALMDFDDSFIQVAKIPVWAVLSNGTKLTLSISSVRGGKAVVTGRLLYREDGVLKPVEGEYVALAVENSQGRITRGGPAHPSLWKRTDSDGRYTMTVSYRIGLKYGLVASYGGSVSYAAAHSPYRIFPK